jgi:hypothetical protein
MRASLGSPARRVSASHRALQPMLAGRLRLDQYGDAHPLAFVAEPAGHLEREVSAVAVAGQMIGSVGAGRPHRGESLGRHGLDRAGKGAPVQAVRVQDVEGPVRIEPPREPVAIESAAVVVAVQVEERRARAGGTERDEGLLQLLPLAEDEPREALRRACLEQRGRAQRAARRALELGHESRRA